MIEILSRALFLVSIAGIGFIVGRRYTLHPREISILLIIVIAPFVIFTSILQAPHPGRYAIYSVGAYAAACAAARCALALGQRFWRDGSANLFAFIAGTGNTGYFGLPLVMGLLNEEGVAIAVFILLGIALYEFSYGYYLTSRGRHSIKQSLSKIIRLPILYAAALALLLKWWGLALSDQVLSSLNHFKGAYSVLGMMIIGITLSTVKTFSIDWRFLGLTLVWKRIAWPTGAMLASALLPISGAAKAAVLLMACVPIAGNTVVIANELNVHPEKAASTVMASTVLAIVSVPLILSMQIGGF